MRSNSNAKRTFGVLVISHGSREEDWVKLVDGAVAQATLPDSVPIVSAYLEIVEGRLIQDGIDQLESQGVTDLIVVPLFASSGSVHVDEIRYALGVQAEPTLPTDLQRFRVNARVHWTAVMDDHPYIVEALLDKIRPLSADPAQEVLLVVGHGSQEDGFYDAWRTVLERLADKLQQQGEYRDAAAALLLPDETGDVMRNLQERYPDCSVILVPFFVSEGYFTRVVIPKRFAEFTYRYNGETLLPHPSIARWISERVEIVWKFTE